MAPKNSIPVEKFAEEIERTSLELFLKRWDTAFLLVEPHGGGATNVFHTGKVDVSAAKQAEESAQDRDTKIRGADAAQERDAKPGEGEAEPKSRGLVFPLRKTNRNLFVNMISVGRTSNNDIMLDNPCVSKLHAFFKPAPDNTGVTITDPGSTSGTTIDGAPLQPNHAVTVESGQVLVFGKAVSATFFGPKGIYEHVKSLKFFKKL